MRERIITLCSASRAGLGPAVAGVSLKVQLAVLLQTSEHEAKRVAVSGNWSFVGPWRVVLDERSLIFIGVVDQICALSCSETQLSWYTTGRRSQLGQGDARSAACSTEWRGVRP